MNNDTFTETFEIEFNDNDCEVEASFEVYANPCGDDPASKEVEPILDSEVVIEAVTVGSIAVPVDTITPKNLDIIKKAVVAEIEYPEYLEELVEKHQDNY